MLLKKFKRIFGPLLQLIKGHTKELERANEQLHLEIAERKRAVEELDHFFDIAPDVLCIAGVDYYFKRFNKALEKIIGYTKEEILAKPFIEFIHPEDRSKTILQIQKLFTGECEFVTCFENRYCCKDGSYRCVEWTAVSVVARGLVYAVARDITERKLAEEVLTETLARSKQREAEITALFNSTSAVLKYKGFEEAAKDIFYSCLNLIGATSGYIMLFNDDNRCYEIPCIELGGQSCTVGLPMPVQVRGIHAEAYRTGKTVYHNDFSNSEWLPLIPKGHIRIDNALYAPFLIDNKVVGLLGLGNKQGGFCENDARIASVFCEIVAVALYNSWTMESLKNSEEKFSKAFENSPVLMSINTLDGRYVDVNKSFTNTTGFTREEVIGRNDEELNIRNPGEGAALLQTMIEQKSVQNLETHMRIKSGHELIGLCSSEIINIKGSEYILSSINDITNLRQLEKDMFRLERLYLVGEMAASIGHEIRNPMTTVRGFLQMLGNKEECVKFKEYFDLMVEELDRANSIITEFLSLARNKSIVLQEQNLTSIIKTLLPLIRANALNSDRHVNVELDDNLPDLLLDEKEIRQLILNLVCNGLEAMSPGGVLTIRTFLDREEVVLAVQDQGKGIENEVLEKIGTPFFTTKDNGTGLGLALCYSIAARHSANIEVATGPEGSEFLVRFRQAKQPA